MKRAATGPTGPGVPANWPTQDQVIDAVRRSHGSTDNPGFCLACGEEQEGCEPDARGYTCESCDEPAVYGAEEVLMMGAYRAQG